MNRGYIKLWRKSKESGFLGNADVWQLLCWCLLNATHKPIQKLVGKQLLALGPGQLIFTGRVSVAKELNSTEKKIRTSLEILKNADFLAVEKASKYSLITIVNWQCYQHEGPDRGQQGSGTRAGKGPANAAASRKYIQEQEKVRQESYDSSPELDKPASEPQPPHPSPPPDEIISLPLNTGPDHPVTLVEVDQWQDLYPGVNVMQELRNMRGWLLGNRKKRKTKAGIGRFIHAWLAKEQNKGSVMVRGDPLPAMPKTYRQAQDMEERQRCMRIAQRESQQGQTNGEFDDYPERIGQGIIALPPPDF